MNLLKAKNIVQCICCVFILLFVYTALSKLFALDAFKTVLHDTPLIGSYAYLFACAIPLAELVTSFFLLIPGTRRTGLWLSFMLMGIFTTYIAYMTAFASHLPCSCGGVIASMSWKEHLLFNIFFTLLGIAGSILEKRSENFIAINRISRTPV